MRKIEKEVSETEIFEMRFIDTKTKIPFVIKLMAIAFVIGILVVIFLLLKPAKESVEEESVMLYEHDATPTNVKQQAIVPVSDSINDVAFAIFSVESLKAAVTFQTPDTSDHNIFLATAAADFRADNQGIVGEFFFNKKQMARGVRKTGWCRISPQGTIAIGMGDAETMKNDALENGGVFFRQYALVMDGEVCPNVLKGKSKRRAIGFLEGKPCIVKSKNRESVFDFSQALADYGFSHALYLPGGEGLWICRTNEEAIYTCEVPANSPDANYLIFTAE